MRKALANYRESDVPCKLPRRSIKPFDFHRGDSKAIAAAINKAVRPGSRCLLRVRNGEALAKSAGRMLVVATFASTFVAAGSGWVALIGTSPSKRESTAPKRMRSPECNVISPVADPLTRVPLVEPRSR